MSTGTPLTQQEAVTFIDEDNLSVIGTFDQPTGAGGGTTAQVLYATKKYGTRPPAGFISNIGGVIDVIKQLQAAQKQPDYPPLQDSTTGAILYLQYLQSLLSDQLIQVMQNLISDSIEITL